MNKKLKFKGSMKQFMRWPLYLTILLIWLDILIFMVSVKAGILATLGIVVYIVAALLLTRFHRPLILNDLIAFANQYESLEKRLLDDLALPYAIMDTNGRMIWSNKVFAELTGKEQLYNKHITTIFPEITPDKLPVPEKQEITEMSTNFGDRIYRVSMQLVTMKDVVNEARILENVDADINLVAMFFYDETELQEYIQKNEDDKLVVALAYLDNYEEALEGVEEVRRSLLIALIDRKITKYFSNFDGLVRKLERDKYFLIMRQSSLEALKEQILSGTIKPGQKLPSENELTRHLLETGRRNIIGIFKADDSQGAQRHKGYVQALQERGIPYDPENVIWFHTEDRKTKPSLMLSMLLDSKKSVDAAVCYNDQIALAVISMLEEKGISVPEDIAVTGYDNSLIGQSSPIGITTIAHPQEKLGEMAAELILEKIRKVPEEESSVKRLISPELIVRESTAGKNLSTETKK